MMTTRLAFFTLPFLVLLGTARAASAQTWEACGTIHERFGAQAGEQNGWVGVGLGDLDGDGVQEFALGSPFRQSFSGRVRIYSGATGALLYALIGSGSQTLGWWIAPTGDADGDGVDDFAIGAPDVPEFTPGRAFLHSGATGALIRSWTGEVAGDRFGNHLADAGDVDGDGLADLIVAAPFHDAAGAQSGRVYVYSSADGSELFRWDGDNVDDIFGAGVAGLGDVTSDGVPDFLIAASHGGAATLGEAYVYSGADGTRLYTVSSDATGGQAYGLLYCGPAGDLNGDGCQDFTISDIWSTVRGANTGQVYAYSGSDGALLYKLPGLAAGDLFGSGHGPIGDIDGDGHDDLAFGAPGDDRAGADAGRVELFSGRTGARLGGFTGDSPGDALGTDVDALGDVDGDGRLDFLLTASGWNGDRGAGYVVSGSPLPPRRSGLPAPNSVGPGVVLETFGPTRIAANSFELTATGGPPGALGVLVVSARPLPSLSPPPRSPSLPIISVAPLPARPRRFSVVGAPVTFDVVGGLRMPLDLAALGLAPGTRWTFELWYRDGERFLRSAGVTLEFCP